MDIRLKLDVLRNLLHLCQALTPFDGGKLYFGAEQPPSFIQPKAIITTKPAATANLKISAVS